MCLEKALRNCKIFYNSTNKRKHFRFSTKRLLDALGSSLKNVCIIITVHSTVDIKKKNLSTVKQVNFPLFLVFKHK